VEAGQIGLIGWSQGLSRHETPREIDASSGVRIGLDRVVGKLADEEDAARHGREFGRVSAHGDSTARIEDEDRIRGGVTLDPGVERRQVGVGR